LDWGDFTVKILAASFALLAAGAAIAHPPAAAPAAAPAATADPAHLFGVRESVEQIDISPDGQKVVYLQPGPGRSAPLGGAQPRVAGVVDRLVPTPGAAASDDRAPVAAEHEAPEPPQHLGSLRPRQ
jgi:hypothetical protein